MVTQAQLDAAVKEAYNYAHNYCHYAPTDRSFPVGNDGKMDCTGLMLRALYILGLIHEPLNCDQADTLMGELGFVKSTDPADIYRHHGFVQWCEPHNVGTEHVNHTYYSLGGDGQTISKYDTGSDPRINAAQPFIGVPTDEWGGRLVFKYMWYPKEQKKLDNNIYLQIGGYNMAATYKINQIKRGDEGNDVLLLQEILKARGMYKGGLDRKFGPATEKAVIDYQDARIKSGANLGKADGIVGPKTWNDILALSKI